MKLLLLCSLVLVVSTHSFSQYSDTSSTRAATDFLKKSKQQKTVAWILLGGGPTLVIVGGVIAFTGTAYYDYDANTVASVMAYTGLAAMVGSIPLFIASGRNREKSAASVSFNMEKATIIKSSLA
jgi:hypothetical protein